MSLEDCYRLLELEPGASDAEVKHAHRDLTKVWHPDRFGSDASLRQKAEDKLKAINEAYETIRASREWPDDRRDDGDWRVRSRGREMRTALTLRQVRVNRIWAFTCALMAILILLRRPTPAGLVIAVVLFGLAFLFVARMRTR